VYAFYLPNAGDVPTRFIGAIVVLGCPDASLPQFSTAALDIDSLTKEDIPNNAMVSWFLAWAYKTKIRLVTKKDPHSRSNVRVRTIICTRRLLLIEETLWVHLSRIL